MTRKVSPNTLSPGCLPLMKLLSLPAISVSSGIIRSFVREVKVTGNEVLLTYAIPMAEGLVEEQLPVTSICKGWWAVGDLNL